MSIVRFTDSIFAGASFEMQIQFLQADGVTPVNLTGYSITAVGVKTSDGTTVFNLTSAITPNQIQVPVPQNGIVLIFVGSDATAGMGWDSITVTVSATLATAVPPQAVITQGVISVLA
jgi:hypothetical protein